MRFVLSLTYAEEHQVGWDTTMKLLAVPDSSPIQELMYDITVRAASGNVVYRTKRLINDIGARSIRGRGTRVWEANKVTDGAVTGDPVALKDSWVDADRMREADILQRLKSAGTGEDFDFVFSNTTLGVECYGDVFIDDRPDHTRQTHTVRQAASGKFYPLPLVNNAASFFSETVAPKSFALKLTEQHHRAVFNMVGSSLYEQNDPYVVFMALAQITIGTSSFLYVFTSFRYILRSSGGVSSCRIRMGSP